jgi:rare lipoprotein A
MLRSRSCAGLLFVSALQFLIAVLAGPALHASASDEAAGRRSVQERGNKPSAESPPPRAPETSVGFATFISQALDGQRTASGAVYDSRRMVAAHRTYPLGTRLRVTNLENGRSVVVRVIDRTAAGTGADRPLVDLSRRAAERLDFIRDGKVKVKIEVLAWGPPPKSR